MTAEDQERTRKEWERLLQCFADMAVAVGFIPTITPVPQQPLAMGNYKLQVNVRVMRGAKVE